MSVKLEKLISLLGDNVWHNIDEIAKTLEIPQNKLQQVIRSLTEADLIQHNAQTNQIKLNQTWKMFSINPNETSYDTKMQSEAATVGTIIIPPQKTLVIQCTRITNLTDSSLELEIRINKKLSEIAINKIR